MSHSPLFIPDLSCLPLHGAKTGTQDGSAEEVFLNDDLLAIIGNHRDLCSSIPPTTLSRRVWNAARDLLFAPLLVPPFDLTPEQICYPSSNELDLKDRNINAAHMPAFAAVATQGGFSETRYLFLHSNQLGDVGLSTLSNSFAKGSFPRLRYMWLSHNQIGDNGMINFTQALIQGALPNLEFLNIYGNNIGGVGVYALADALNSGAIPKIGTLIISKPLMAHTTQYELLKEAAQRRQYLKLVDYSSS